MIVRLLYWLGQLSSRLRRALWNGWHLYVSGVDRDLDLAFFNYGFAELEGHKVRLELREEDEKNRFCIQLYHHVASAVDLRDRDVLEIGCGRGGGASYVHGYLRPRSTVAMDISKGAIRFCRERYTLDGLSFCQGDATLLPFNDSAFDVIINVESSNAYGDVGLFLREARRVLRRDGHLLLADMRPQSEIDRLVTQIKDAGLSIQGSEVITPNVVRAMDLDDERKRDLIRRKAPGVLARSFAEFAGVRGSAIYDSMKTGQRQYLNFVLRRLG